MATATAGSFALADDHTYDVRVSVAAAGLQARTDISTGELMLDTTPPLITLNPISPNASGASVINGFEQGQSVTLTGTTTAQVGSTVTLTGLDGVARTAIVQAGPNGLNTYSIPVPGTVMNAMADGSYTPTVSVTNLFGLTGTDTENLLVDTTAPAAPTVVLPEAPGGVSASEAANGTPLQISLPAGLAVGDTLTTVVINPDGTALVLSKVLTTTDLALGIITQTIPAAALTVDGPWTTSTTLTDAAGNVSAPQPGSFVLDTQAPGLPGVALPEAANGVNAAEALSNGGTPIAVTLPGDALVGDTVTTVVTLPDGSTLTLSHVLTTADITAGSISQLIASSALTQDGSWTTSTTVTDLAGNASAPRTGSFVLDTTPPPAPAAALAVASDSGTLGDKTTSDTTPSISGTGTPGDTLTVTFPGGEVKTAVVAADGSWSVTPTTTLAEGVQTVLITATDPAGNTSAATALPLTIDTTAPAAPTAVLAPSSDTGVVGDGLTSDNTPTLIKLSLADTDAAAGNTITLNWGGQTISVTLSATDIANGYVDVPVTFAQLTAETPAGTSESVVASVTLLSGSTVVAQSGAQGVDVNFVLPTAPTINALTWASTGAGNTSALSGIPEAEISGFSSTWGTISPSSAPVDNKLYYNEVANPANLGTILRVQLPTAGVTGVANPALAGDTLTLTWGNQVINVGALTAANITAKSVDVTIPFATIDSHGR